MSKNSQLANATVNAQGATLSALLNGGYLNIYAGPQPGNADTAVTTQILLAQLRFGSPSAAAPLNGIVTFNAITSGTALATGTAAWFRTLQSDGQTVVMDGSIDLAANTPNLALNSLAIAQGAQVSVSSFVHTLQKSTAGL